MDERMVETYAEIDAFSQCKHPFLPTLPGLASRNMGKNDLWIAATAHFLEATLRTTDHDFNHLAPDFLEMARIEN